MKAKAIFKYIIIALACFGTFLSIERGASAQTNPPALGMFSKANELFQQGNYEQAKKTYLEIIDSGVYSGNIYYNLGNTYFKLGQLGRAIVNYERAKILLPQDSDVQANLQYALSLCNNSVVPLKHFWLISFINKIAEQLTLDGWTIVLSGVYFLILLFAAGFMLTKIAGFKKTAIVLLCGLVFVSCIWWVKFQQIRITRNAVIIVTEIDSRFAPSEDAVVHFKSYEGAGIEVIDRKNTWVRIKTPDGKIGWVPEIAVEII